MKVAIIVPYFYPMVGGLESYVHHASKYLSKVDNYEVIVITSNHLAKGDSVAIVDGVKVYRLHYWFRLSNTPVSPNWIFKINSIFSVEKPDIIFAHSPVPFISDVSSVLAYFRGIPFTLMYHAGNLKKNQKIADFIVSIYTNTFERIMFGNTKKMIVLNEFVKENTLRNYKNKVELIFPGITLPSIGKQLLRKNKHSRVLFVGKLDRSHSWKGLSYLLKAFVKVLESRPDATLTIVGNGDNIEYYKDLSNKYHIDKSTKFVGNKSAAEVPQYYKNSDLLVLPSTSSAESLGFVILEAMSFGLPVVASRIGGIPYVLKDTENGLLVEPRDVEGLSKAILKICTDKKFYEKVSKNNLNTTSLYNWQNHIQKLTNIFDSIHNEKKNV